MGIKFTPNWDKVRYYVASLFGATPPPKNIARQGLAEFLQASRAENLIINQKMANVLRSAK